MAAKRAKNNKQLRQEAARRAAEKQAAEIRKKLDSIVPPLELTRRPLFSVSNHSETPLPVGFFTTLRINSLDLGVLYPAQYRVVTNRNNQSVRLATWAFRHIAETAADLPRDTFITCYVPAKMLMRDTLHKLLQTEADKGADFLSRLVVEFSSELFYEDAVVVAEKLQALHADFGVRFLLSEYGDAYCPVLRLAAYPVDFVLLDSSISNADALLTPAVRSAVKIATDLGKTVILDAPGCRQIAAECGIQYYMGADDTERGR